MRLKVKNNKKKLKALKLSFPEFTDDWEKCELGEILKYEQPTNYLVLSTDYDNSFETPVLTAGQSFILGYTDEINNIKEASPENPVIIFDDFTTGSHYVDFSFKVKSSAIKLLDLKSRDKDFYFSYITLKNIKFIPKGHERHWISKFSGFKVYVPQINEQIKIGKFFKEIDQLITLNQNKISHIKDLKAGLLQKMFPKNGETKPEIRFDGFTSDWKECRLGEVKDVRDGTHDSPKYQNKGFPLITSKNIKESGLDMSNVSLISFEDFNAINQRSKVDIGDIIFGMIGTIGNPIILERDDFAIKNVALLKNGGSIDNRFLLQLLKSPVFELYMKKENAGGTQKFLGLSQIRNLNFLVPELSEQKKIGEFFSQLDKLLTLYQRKVEHLQEQKKSLLKQMFI